MNENSDKQPKIFDNINTWMTHDEAAEYLRLTPNAFRIIRCRDNIEIPAYRLGRRLRFKKNDLDRLLEFSEQQRRI